MKSPKDFKQSFRRPDSQDSLLLKSGAERACHQSYIVMNHTVAVAADKQLAYKAILASPATCLKPVGSVAVNNPKSIVSAQTEGAMAKARLTMVLSILFILPNKKRSHAGPVTPNSPQDALPALAGGAR